MACCRDCNIKKDNRPIEQCLTDQPDLLERILTRLKRSALSSATHMNAVLPALIEDLRATGRRVYLTDAASVSWTRQQLNVRKTHCYDAVLQGRDFTSVNTLPSKVIELRPSSGRSKQKAERRPTRHTRRPAVPSTTNAYPTTSESATPPPATPTATNATAT